MIHHHTPQTLHRVVELRMTLLPHYCDGSAHKDTLFRISRNNVFVFSKGPHLPFGWASLSAFVRFSNTHTSLLVQELGRVEVL